VLELEPPHTANSVRALPALDRAGRHLGMPAVVPIEVAQNLPHPVAGRVDDRALDHPWHAALAPERPLERVAPALEYTSADVGDESDLLLGRAIELRRPLDEGSLAVGHRGQTQGRDIVLDAHRRLEDRVGAEHVVVGEAEQLFADAVAVPQPE